MLSTHAIAPVACALAALALASPARAEKPLAEARPDKALVYVLRPAAIAPANPAYFFVDDTFVGVTRANENFFTYVDPGPRLFWSRMENVDALELEVAAGRTYYVQQRVSIGLAAARVKLALLEEDKGGLVLRDDVGRMAEVSDDERRRGEEHAKRLFEKAKKEAARR